MYRAVIFDFDGTIIDTERHLFETINKHLKLHKAEPISVDFYRESIGGTATDLHQHLEQAIGADNKEKYIKNIIKLVVICQLSVQSKS